MSYLGKAELKNSKIKKWTGSATTNLGVSFVLYSSTGMGFTPFNKESTWVTINGIKQHEYAYSLQSTQLSFASSLAATDEVEVVCIFDVGIPTYLDVIENTVDVAALKTSDGTAGQVLTTDGVGNLSFSSKSTETLSSMGVTVSATELNHVDGITSNINNQLLSKQDTLVSATNIKSINGDSILGSGNLAITGWSYATTLKFA
jgi:hypothetical protein